ncbi:MAG: carbamate kinase [Candidatus Ranarchaeia archaeon]
MTKRIVVALGGNAILQRGQKGIAEEQFENVYRTALQLANLVKDGYQLIITHGNGPQVGSLLLQQEAGQKLQPPVAAQPLDVCGSMSQGQIGYMIVQQLHNILVDEGITKSVVTVLSQVQVDPKDPLFQNPTKPVGPFYSEEVAQSLIKEKNYVMKEDAGRGWRRVVASPDPIGLVEVEIIKQLVNNGHIVVCSGGGGIPVFKDEKGKLKGTIAVIDKDLAGERLATAIKADLFVILTDIEKVCINYNKPNEEKIDSMNIDTARKYLEEGHFAKGSMEPKCRAAIRFIEHGGSLSVITSLDKATDAIKGKAGTQVTKV